MGGGMDGLVRGVGGWVGGWVSIGGGFHTSIKEGGKRVKLRRSTVARLRGRRRHTTTYTKQNKGKRKKGQGQSTPHTSRKEEKGTHLSRRKGKITPQHVIISLLTREATGTSCPSFTTMVPSS